MSGQKTKKTIWGRTNDFLERMTGSEWRGDPMVEKLRLSAIEQSDLRKRQLDRPGALSDPQHKYSPPLASTVKRIAGFAGGAYAQGLVPQLKDEFAGALDASAAKAADIKEIAGKVSSGAKRFLMGPQRQTLNDKAQGVLQGPQPDATAPAAPDYTKKAVPADAKAREFLDKQAAQLIERSKSGQAPLSPDAGDKPMQELAPLPPRIVQGVAEDDIMRRTERANTFDPETGQGRGSFYAKAGDKELQGTAGAILARDAYREKQVEDERNQILEALRDHRAPISLSAKGQEFMAEQKKLGMYKTIEGKKAYIESKRAEAIAEKNAKAKEAEAKAKHAREVEKEKIKAAPGMAAAAAAEYKAQQDRLAEGAKDAREAAVYRGKGTAATIAADMKDSAVVDPDLANNHEKRINAWFQAGGKKNIESRVRKLGSAYAILKESDVDMNSIVKNLDKILKDIETKTFKNRAEVDAWVRTFKDQEPASGTTPPVK